MLQLARSFPQSNWVFFLRQKSNYLSWLFRLVLAAVFLLTTYYGYSYFTTEAGKPPLELVHLQALRKKAGNSNDEICRVPVPNPWDSSIRSYYSKPAPLKCQPVQEQLASLENGYLVFDEKKLSGKICNLIPFKHNTGVSDSDVKFLNTSVIDFATSTYKFKVPHEFFEVNCMTDGLIKRDVYKMHFAQILPKSQSSVKKNQAIEKSSLDRPSVIMIGLDSMSRGNFIRQLPVTHKTMQRMGFQDMLGHIKIGDNTYTNWMAILTGKRGTTTKEFDAELDENWDIAFDDFDLVWKRFSEQGYATLFAEDRPDIGTFNYFGYLLGFLEPPTDHYFRPFWLAAYYSIIGRRSTSYCYDSKGKHKVQLEYLQDFIRKYSDKRKFAYWWIQDMNHDFLNLIGSTDLDFDEFLNANEKYLNDSIVFVFSDHGHRYDKIRETVIGRLEARLPFLSIRIPPAMKQKYPELVNNLKENSNKMTTQFDTHQVLQEIATGSFSEVRPKLDSKTQKDGKLLRAYSYFHPTPTKRTCFDANIPEDYCPCYSETEIPLEEATKPAQVLVNALNEQMSAAEAEEYDSNGVARLKSGDFTCLQLELDRVTYASIRLPPPKLVEDPKNGMNIPISGLEILYRIVFQAKPPSNAIIEGVVVRNFNTEKWTTTGEIERNNRYGNSSHCVADQVLKKICHCVLSKTSTESP